MIVIDIEASGLNSRVSSILSIGAVEFENPRNRFYGECKAFEGAHLEEGAFAVNGFTKESATDESKQTEGELYNAFVTWALLCGEQTIASQNPTFDTSFLMDAAIRAHKEYPFAHRTLDTHSFAWMHMVTHGHELPKKNKHSGLSLVYSAPYVGIPEEAKPHNALTGALLHAELIARLVYNTTCIVEYRDYPLPWLTKS